MTLPKDQQGTFTYGDCLAWPEEERWELIDGVAYNMTPAPTRFHQRVVMELGRQIANFLHDKPCEIYIAPFDVRLPDQDESDDDVHTVVQPDLAIICDPAKLDERGCRGAPDWIIEVLSPATAAKDQIRKVELYQHHGVREYWTVHPTDRVVMVRYLEDSGQFSVPKIIEGTGTLAVQVLPELEIDLDQVYAT